MQTTSSFFRSVLRMVFSFFLFASLTMAVGFSHPNPSSDETVEQREIGNYRSDLKTFMKLSKDDVEQIQRNAIYNLCVLHHEIVQDTRFQDNPILQGFRATAAKRLDDFASDIEKQAKREARAKKKERKSSGSFQSSNTSSGNELNGFEEGLGGFEAASSDSNEFANDESGFDVDDDSTNAAYEFASDSYYSLGQLSGGPNQMFNYAGGRFAPPWDHGPELVALIENTINPLTWQANGGSGAIHYFRPLRVLVISSTQRVNDNTLDFLRQLRRANGTQINIR